MVFDISDCVIATEEMRQRIADLVEDVEFDINKPLLDEDEDD